MAQRNVTRTIITSVFSVVAVDLTNNSVVTTEVAIPSVGNEVTDEVKKCVADQISPLALAALTLARTEENLYVMSEADFIKNAEKRPARGTKETE